MSDSDASPYAGSITPPPGAGRRTDDRPTGVASEHLPGGLLARGTRVLVRILHGARVTEIPGEIVDWASVPAPYLSILSPAGGRAVVFLGPGVTVEPDYDHPGLR